ncbi:Carboxypeptidase Y inhibitor, function requires acetylation by the NatB N-terminal acetyltransferase [Komagataella phaffii GS115]|uniref:Carboxypeptidase Y inhibitor, function requires acetylation by the NatB N-terminal acetyltransferase n=2 Tax=Komagataella phaffii TaxID=460519 RepID=C4R553_KOMPG|nr:Carboxypeptidase Y inhibitor, function requires acetylation by the NatB N-terminal acetyltransferase [Komagataella phaffii GS115]AOA63624.1 GQ67_03725T0 [Komagataella phaffii]AOA69252.1 GQ68_03697T0 [Komagataella phaffii GS115]CAY70689.1 Carboxypeptidase Y inhibitor, function requires acetylation by the NatB N-terminal acetyltransferase [Komagataella phaffii GS115]
MLLGFQRFPKFHTLTRKSPINSIRSLRYKFQRPLLTPLFLSPIIKQSMNLVTISDSIRENLIKHEVIPDVIKDKSFVPKGLLIISYGSPDKEVVLGNTLKVEDAQSIPKITFTVNLNEEQEIASFFDEKFTLVVTDPDAPSRTDNKWSEFCHYVVSDLSLSTKSGTTDAEDQVNFTTDLKVDTIPESDSKTLVPYLGPGPPPKTGLHRYVFLLYKQKPGVSLEGPDPKNRPNWGTGIPGSGVSDWAAKNSLSLLAVNFFFAQNKDN